MEEKFPRDLKHWKYEIERIGRRLGYECVPTVYYLVDSEHMSEIASLAGYPIRFHHWSFGQESYHTKKRLTKYGLGTIYEMVIPNNPCLGYLLDTNNLLIQKMVMAHVVGHNDFFTNNFWFKEVVPGNIRSLFANNALTLDRIQEEVGKEKVDAFIELCLSLENLIDIMSPTIKRVPVREKNQNLKKQIKEPGRLKVPEGMPGYMDSLLNPPDSMKKKMQDIESEQKRESEVILGKIIPEEPVRDILGFFLEHACLESWQAEVLQIIREENFYLWVGAQTQIMNEGWAATCEAEIMQDESVASAGESRSYSRSHAGVLSPHPGSINPYGFGAELWKDIKYKWDTGRHGKIYDRCEIADVMNSWDEFAVFKKIYETYRSDCPELRKTWRVFLTLIKETEENKGARAAISFNKTKWVNEWLEFINAETNLEIFKNKLLKVSLAEKEITGKAEAENIPKNDTRIFKLRQELIKNNGFDPDLDWTEEEVLQKIYYFEKLVDLKNKLNSENFELVEKFIPDSWFKWAEQNPENLNLGMGREKMFEVRKTHNDISFIQDFFTQELCERKGFYTISKGEVFDPQTYDPIKVYKVKSTAFKQVRNFLISSRLNMRQPRITLVDANMNNNKELLFVHLHDGRDLDMEDIPGVLKNIGTIWGYGKKVFLNTIETSLPPADPWKRYRPKNAVQEKKKPKYTIVQWIYTPEQNTVTKVYLSQSEADKYILSVIKELEK